MSGTRRRTASHWGSYWITVEGNEVTKVDPVTEDPDPSPIGQNYRGILRSDARIRRPAVREGWLTHGPGSTDARGSEAFVEVEWDEAFRLVANELDRVRAEHGNEAIFGGSYGWGSAGRFHHAQSQVHRFLNSLGGYTRSVNSYSYGAEEVILPHIVGNRDWLLKSVPSWENIAAYGEFVLAFGGLPRRSVEINPGGVGAHVNASWQDRCAEAGVEFAVVTPSYRDSGAKLRARWIPARPNTDVALMLALCHTLLVENLFDSDFVTRCCVGFDRVKNYLLGVSDAKPKDADWASEICDISADEIRLLARKVAAKRTLISVSWSLQRQHHGEMTYWAALTLAAMSGDLGKPGGGFGPGYSSIHNAHIYDRRSPAAALPQGTNPVSAFIPVARISDMLLNPGASFDYNGTRHSYPDIRLLYWAGGNPFHHHQDLNKLLRAWQKPETVIVHEPFWNSTAKQADIVFPVATSLEREDFSVGTGDDWLSYMEKAADAPDGVLTDYEVFARIAGHLGVGEAFTEGRSPTQWVRELYERSVPKSAALGIDLPPFEEFKRIGGLQLLLPRTGTLAFAKLRESPEDHPLDTPSGKLELFSETIHAFEYADCPGQAVWLEPREWLGGPLAATFPLHLVSPQPDGKLHSQLDHGIESRRHKVNDRAVLHMHPSDADRRGVTDGNIVRVFNDRGSCLAAVRILDGIMESVVQLPTGAWFDPSEPRVAGSLCKHGNPNVLTADIGTSSLAQGSSAHTCLVQVELFQGDLPAVTAFDPPPMASIPATGPSIKQHHGWN
jgi:biotin/methionine sulfoxide reductase